jgi:hypothetical protein
MGLFNNRGDGLPRPSGRYIAISNNVLTRTRKAVARYEDFGVGPTINADGIAKPTDDFPISDEALGVTMEFNSLGSHRAIRLRHGAADVVVSNNLVYGYKHGIFITIWNQFENLSLRRCIIRDNSIMRFSREAIAVDPGEVPVGTTYISDILVQNNVFDGDPEYEYADRNPDGSWANSGDIWPCAYSFSGGKGWVRDNNIIRNVRQSFRDLTSYVGTFIRPDLIYGEIVAGGFSSSNKGVGEPGFPAFGFVGVSYDTNLSSSTFGSARASGPNAQATGGNCPTEGYYLPGTVVKAYGSPTYTPSANGNILFGWVRVTAADAGHVQGVDWLPLYVKTTDT